MSRLILPSFMRRRRGGEPKAPDQRPVVEKVDVATLRRAELLHELLGLNRKQRRARGVRVRRELLVLMLEGLGGFDPPAPSDEARLRALRVWPGRTGRSYQGRVLKHDGSTEAQRKQRTMFRESPWIPVR